MRVFRAARYWLLGLVILLAAASPALLPACGGDEDKEASPTVKPTATASAKVTPTAAAGAKVTPTVAATPKATP
ncbi:MAG: hypothetical protein MUP14_08555 [Dehalococcoidia bacterium]|nr:hypothetical protein [Dehalococcoidia bacterium]